MSNKSTYLAAGIAGVIGFACVALDVWGTWEWSYGLEGRVSYFVLASPLMAIVAAMCFALAEFYVRRRMWWKAAAWFLLLIPTAAVVFFATAERIHLGKAGAEAERSAYRAQVERALTSYNAAKDEHDKAAKAATEARAWKRKDGPQYRTRLSAETDSKARLDAAQAALLKAEGMAKAESPYKMPPELMPVALFVVGLVALWSAFGSHLPNHPKQITPETRTTKRKRRKGKAKAAPRKRLKLIASNENVAAGPPAA